MSAGFLRSRCGRAAIAIASLACTLPAIAQSERRSIVTPYLGVDQVVLAPLKGEGEVLTYTNLIAGLRADVQTRRLEAMIDAQYNHSLGWNREAGDFSLLSGIANARLKVAPGLSLDAGGIATRVRGGGFSGGSSLNGSSTSQVYGGYVGPTYVGKAGIFDVTGGYRLGYVRVDDGDSSDFNGIRLGSRYGESWSHSLNGSIGVAPGVLLPLGLVASAGYAREDADRLDQRFENIFGRLDATLPVSPTVALVGGIGYEEFQLSQRSPVLGGDGTPVIRNGGYVTDETSPRQLIYDQDGLIWDAGVLWRPSRRTRAEARIGHRYGGMTYQGSFTWQGRNSSFGLVLFDGIDSFGRVITSDVAALSGSLDIARNPFTQDLTGCAFSTTGGGRCFNDALSGVTGANFRYRGVAAQYGTTFGPWQWGIGGGYSQRKFITAGNELVLIRGTKDENWFANTNFTYAINERDNLDTIVYFNYFDGTGRTDVMNVGASTSYFRGLTRRLSASASLGVDGVKADDIDTVISAMGQVGLRYSF